MRRWKNPEKRSRVKIFDAQFRAHGESKPIEGLTKFCMWVDIQDIITCETFGDDRLRGLGVARGRISRFPIDLRRRPYSPYNTRTTVRVCDDSSSLSGCRPIRVPHSKRNRNLPFSKTQDRYEEFRFRNGDDFETFSF